MLIGGAQNGVPGAVRKAHAVGTLPVEGDATEGLLRGHLLVIVRLRNGQLDTDRILGPNSTYLSQGEEVEFWPRILASMRLRSGSDQPERFIRPDRPWRKSRHGGLPERFLTGRTVRS